MAKHRTNAEMHDMVKALAEAEKKINVAASKMHVHWRWAPYSKPSTGGPYLWNDIVILYPDGKQRTEQALVFVEEVEGGTWK